MVVYFGLVPPLPIESLVLVSRLDGRFLMDRSSVARVSGPLASWEEAYRLWLAAQGYSPWTVSDLVWQLDGLSRWLSASGSLLAS